MNEPIKPQKADNLEKFNPAKHKIKNNSIAGLIPVWIPTERMYVYVKSESDIDRVKSKWATLS